MINYRSRALKSPPQIVVLMRLFSNEAGSTSRVEMEISQFGQICLIADRALGCRTH